MTSLPVLTASILQVEVIHISSVLASLATAQTPHKTRQARYRSAAPLLDLSPSSPVKLVNDTWGRPEAECLLRLKLNLKCSNLHPAGCPTNLTR